MPAERVSESVEFSVEERLRQVADASYTLWRFGIRFDEPARTKAVRTAENGMQATGSLLVELGGEIDLENLRATAQWVCEPDMWDRVPDMENWVVSRLADGLADAGHPGPRDELGDRYYPPAD